MNDLINDIEKLQKVTDTISKNIPNGIFMKCFMPLMNSRGLIKEKQKSVTEFEKQAPNHIQDLCNQLRGAI
jgi:hypothetical protein